jgi:rod shape-determining protein MreB
VYILDSFSAPEIAIDLGTANTRIGTARSALVESVTQIADAAPGGVVRFPLRHGFVVDIQAASELLTPLIRQVAGRKKFPPRALVCIPNQATDDEREALITATMEAGAKAVAIVPEVLAAAVGGGVDLASASASMLVDVGHGVTDVAVFRAGQIVRSASLRVACSDLHILVGDWLKWHRGIAARAQQLERIVRTACAHGVDDAFEFTFVDEAQCAPVTAGEVRALLDTTLDDIAGFVADFFVRLPDADAAEVIESGVVVTGGGAALPRCIDRLAQSLRMVPRTPDDPLHAVINGARSMLETARATDLWK